jgi:hypothetical protein
LRPCLRKGRLKMLPRQIESRHRVPAEKNIHEP